MYALMIDEKIAYVSDNIELLQELMMDEYFDEAYKNWIKSNFTIPYLYQFIKIANPPKFKYCPPQKWWKEQSLPMKTSYYEIINLSKYYIT